MASLRLSTLVLLAACGGAPRTDATKPATVGPTTPPPATAACTLDGPILVSIAHSPIARANMPDTSSDGSTLQIATTGAWCRTGTDPGPRTGQVASADRDLLAAAIAAAKFQIGVSVCDAIPMTNVTMSAGDKKGSWGSPCGGEPDNATATTHACAIAVTQGGTNPAADACKLR